MRDRILITLVYVFAILGVTNIVGDSSKAQATGGGTTVTVSPKVALDAATLSSATSKQPPPKSALTKIAPTSHPKAISVNPATVKATRQGNVDVSPSRSTGNIANVKPRNQGLPAAIVKPASKAPSINPGTLQNAARARLDDTQSRIDGNLNRDLRSVLEVAPERMSVPGASDLGNNRGSLTDIPGGIGRNDDPLRKMPDSKKTPNDALVNVMPDSTTPRARLGNAGPSERRGQGGHFLVPTPRDAMGGAASSDPTFVTDKQTTQEQGANNTTIHTTHITRADGTREMWQENRTSDGDLTFRRHIVTDSEGNTVSDRYRGAHPRDRGRGSTDPSFDDTAGNPDPYGGDADSPLARELRERINVGPAPDLTFRNLNDDTTDPDERAGPGGPPTGPRVVVSREQLVGDPTLAEARRQTGGTPEPVDPDALDPGPGARPPSSQ
jgi:hypothetical protein